MTRWRTTRAATDPLLRVLLPFLRRGVDRVTEDEVRDWWWTHPANLFADLPGRDGAPLRRTSDGDVVYLLCAARGHRRLAA